MKFFRWIVIGSFVFLTTACSWWSRDGQENVEPVEKRGQDILTGSMDVVVDESVIHLLTEQVDVFHSDYVNSRISLVAQPERVAINTLLQGKATVAILTRVLTDEESAGFKQRSVTPRVFPVAYDGIVLVTNKSSQDSLISIADIKAYLNGQSVTGKKLVFDNVNSSALRFLKDLSELERVVSTHVQAADSIEEVFRMVSESDNQIGVMSLNQYLAHRESLDIADNIRILGVKNEGDGQYYKPSQSSLAEGTYPLKQQVYVLNYQPNLGLGIGFSAFLTGDRGQRIVLRSGILPAKMPGRELIIRDELKL